MSDSIAMKRFEIVVGIEQLDQLVELLKRFGIRGYTVIKGVGGLGTRGIRDPDDVLLTDENSVVIFTCKEDQAQKALDELRPAMRGFGGMCLITNCHAQAHSFC
ncbi:nitrogen regulatory protein P-II family [Nitrosomonas sp. Nm84]|uniref:DUF190 domain-containing protein n=1 Tax=Nitrosomonas sp. Nm84 TaxID=200124 RepID=UPI000D76432D|nr:DUF190 domain-containing protein [Nitrosomonas sp. Nm84]PXW82558.1 nitrogen regulatory protein P-II family [Nitrosomonas sp. Nm84]